MELDARKLDARYETLRSERSGWDSAWQDLAELFSPTRWRADTDNTSHKEPRINSRLLDSTGVLGMRTLAAGLQGGMTSPVRPWFRLRLAHDNGSSQPSGVNAWLDEVSERMRILLHQSNFYNCIHSLYADLGTFGTGLMYEDADENGLKFQRVPAGEYVIDVDGDGFVDTVFRRIYLTARQMIDIWGEKDVPESVLNVARASHSASNVERFNVVHGVFPRSDVKLGQKVSVQGKPFVSVYWVRDAGGSGRAQMLSESGYDMMPFFAPRWDINANDVYGRSPAMDVMPDCKMLQAMTETLRRTQHKIADPPMIGDSNLRRYGVDRNPGGFTFGDFAITQGRPLVMPIQQPDAAAVQHAMEALREVKDTINNGLYVDLFRMLMDDDRRQVTATEIQAKQAEKMLLIGPVVERLHTELLSPLIKRTYQLMGEYGALPEPPDEMQDAELDVEFESVLAQAQKVTATSAIEQGVAFLANFAGVKPEALDVIDADKTARAYMDRIGMPQACIAEEQAVEAARQKRAQMEQAAQTQQEMASAGQAAMDVTGAAKNLGQTPAGADGQTLMQSLVGGITGAGGM